MTDSAIGLVSRGSRELLVARSPTEIEAGVATLLGQTVTQRNEVAGAENQDIGIALGQCSRDRVECLLGIDPSLGGRDRLAVDPEASERLRREVFVGEFEVEGSKGTGRSWCRVDPLFETVAKFSGEVHVEAPIGIVARWSPPLDFKCEFANGTYPVDIDAEQRFRRMAKARPVAFEDGVDYAREAGKVLMRPVELFGPIGDDVERRRVVRDLLTGDVRAASCTFIGSSHRPFENPPIVVEVKREGHETFLLALSVLPLGSCACSGIDPCPVLLFDHVETRFDRVETPFLFEIDPE
jgi:hypothetical protein